MSATPTALTPCSASYAGGKLRQPEQSLPLGGLLACPQGSTPANSQHLPHQAAEQRALTSCMPRSYYGQQRSIDAATAGEERCAQRAEQGEARRRAWLEQEQLAERQVRPLGSVMLLPVWLSCCQSSSCKNCRTSWVAAA